MERYIRKISSLSLQGRRFTGGLQKYVLQCKLGYCVYDRRVFAGAVRAAL